jgi:tetratricopeptide (TPR) repeat protein
LKFLFFLSLFLITNSISFYLGRYSLSKDKYSNLDHKTKINRLIQTAIQINNQSAPTTNEAKKLIETLEKVLELEPNNQQALEMLSNSLTRYNLKNQAIDISKKCIKYHQKSELCHGNLTTLYSFESNPNKLKISINNCLQIMPYAHLCLYNKAILEMKQEKYKESIKILKLMKTTKETITFDMATINYQIGFNYLKLKNFSESQNHLSISCQQKNINACNLLKQISKEKKQ